MISEVSFQGWLGPLLLSLRWGRISGRQGPMKEEAASFMTARSKHALVGFLLLPLLLHPRPQLTRWCHPHSKQVPHPTPPQLLSYTPTVWKNPHRRTLNCALLISYSSLHPTKLTIKMNHHSDFLLNSRNLSFYSFLNSWSLKVHLQ
jgi:hypothetical protein